MKGIKRILAIMSGAIIVSVWGTVLYYTWIFNEVVGGIATLGSLIGTIIAVAVTEG